MIDFQLSIRLRTISTFSCDIARPVSRRLPLGWPPLAGEIDERTAAVRASVAR